MENGAFFVIYIPADLAEMSKEEILENFSPEEYRKYEKTFEELFRILNQKLMKLKRIFLKKLKSLKKFRTDTAFQISMKILIKMLKTLIKSSRIIFNN